VAIGKDEPLPSLPLESSPPKEKTPEKDLPVEKAENDAKNVLESIPSQVVMRNKGKTTEAQRRALATR